LEVPLPGESTLTTPIAGRLTMADAEELRRRALEANITVSSALRAVVHDALVRAPATQAE
jgi:hypothetical protein